MNDDPREFVFTRYEARHGMAWLTQAYALFSRKRLPWLLLLLTYYILLKLLLYAPYVGAYAISILKPVFAVGEFWVSLKTPPKPPKADPASVRALVSPVSSK